MAERLHTHLVEKPRVLTGAAGGLGTGVRVGDVVVARELLQHDMDASPLFPRYEVPLTGRSRFPTDADLSDALATAALHCLQHAAERIGEAIAEGMRALKVMPPAEPEAVSLADGAGGTAILCARSR